MELLPKPKRRSGVRRASKQITKLLNEYQATEGMSVVEFCLKHKIKKATFYNWQKRSNAALPGQNKAGCFIAVQPLPAPGAPLLFAEVNGIRLYQVVAPDYLKALVS